MSNPEALAIQSGKIRIYHLFEVADLIQLDRITTLLGKGPTKAQIAYTKPIPSYIRFANPPLMVSLGRDELQLHTGEIRPLEIRAKLFEYGIISVIMEMEFSGSWQEFHHLGKHLIASPQIEEKATGYLKTIVDEIRDALVKLYPVFHFSEDYVIFQVHRFASPLTPTVLETAHSGQLARLLRGEDEPLGTEEEKEVLRHRFSYGQKDLVVVDWNSAFIYDTPEESYPLADILEYANSQLLELRYYDSLLDSELNATYGAVIPRKPAEQISGIGTLRKTAQKLMVLMVEVTELTERIENSLKIIGDLYYARIYRAAAQRLSLREWENNIDNKIRIINSIHSALTSRIYSSRSIALEVLVVLLILIEVIIFIWAEFK